MKAQVQKAAEPSPYSWLARHASNHTSQWGEDGIIAAIFRAIGTTNRHVVDVGAGDGLMFSNSRLLIEQGWSATLIEADDARYSRLFVNTERYVNQPLSGQRVRIGNYRVVASGAYSLDTLLEHFEAPIEFDLLSLDIDGQEYWIFNSLLKYRPRVICIEYDPNVASDFIPEPDGEGQAGLQALLYVAQTKGYVPVGRTETNLLLVRRELAALVEREGEGEAVETEAQVKIAALMSLPRYGPLTARGIVEAALRPFGIPLNTFGGVFWGQCMQRALEDYIAQGLDWVLTIDYDSLFTAEHLDALFGIFGSRPDIDALAALQCRRGSLFPLMTITGEQGTEVTGEPIRVDTAHFGMTLIRLDALRDVPKPWFKGEPDSDGGYGDLRLDDDIWFWKQWGAAGKSLYVAPSVSIGHLEEMVAVFDEQMRPSHMYVKDWITKNDPKRVRITGA